MTRVVADGRQVDAESGDAPLARAGAGRPAGWLNALLIGGLSSYLLLALGRVLFGLASLRARIFRPRSASPSRCPV